MRAIGGVYCDGGPAPSDDLDAVADALLKGGYGAIATRSHGAVGLAFAETFAAKPFPIAESPIAEAAGVVVLLDGRLDDRATLLAALDRQDVSLQSTDAELVLAAYRKWGADSPKQLIGDYAFVVFDPDRRTLLCARDHIGARPFFYTVAKGRFVFASDVNAILAVAGVDSDFDERTIATALCDRSYDPLAHTFFRAIRRLPPGYCASVTGRRVRLARYWAPARAKPIRLPTAQAYADRLRALFDAAVADRLRGGSRYGVHLSGGLDSTSIAASAATALRLDRRPEPTAFSWHRLDPDAPPDSEPAWSEAARAAIGIELVAPLPETGLIVARLRADGTREPNPDNLLNEEPVQYAAAARGIDVMLSGWGGDQAASFEGRGLDAERFRKGQWRTLWREHQANGLHTKLRWLWRAARDSLPSRATRRPKAATSFGNADFLKRVAPRRIVRVRRSSTLRTMQDLYAKGPMTARLEVWAQSGAKHGIDYRYPLLDRRILDFCYAIPGDLFRHDGRERWLMRTAMADLLPPIVAAFASKDEPVRGADLAPPLLEAFGILADEIAAMPDAFGRGRYIDIPALVERMRAPWPSTKGQAPVRLALQFLDFPPQSPDPARPSEALQLPTARC